MGLILILIVLFVLFGGGFYGYRNGYAGAGFGGIGGIILLLVVLFLLFGGGYGYYHHGY